MTELRAGRGLSNHDTQVIQTPARSLFTARLSSLPLVRHEQSMPLSWRPLPAPLPLKLTDNKVFTWGRGQDGRLGLGDYANRWEPCRVEGLGSEPVTLIAAGKAHSMAVALPQAVHVWGRG